MCKAIYYFIINEILFSSKRMKIKILALRFVTKYARTQHNPSENVTLLFYMESMFNSVEYESAKNNIKHLYFEICST